ncbi:hypothetical protein [Lentzea sp. HUAS12]|uniref:hypothetical protein n=1 Tax=Lentzea sp. HUAS12 TaxID=2951806 RepID=UPI0020A04758|nr:hypothetical protein [Lentzea sp. HUAS12]USX56379.1 hypothetical protein ND450_20430 [Lentzea sp. HUAS12]
MLRLKRIAAALLLPLLLVLGSSGTALAGAECAKSAFVGTWNVLYNWDGPSGIGSGKMSVCFRSDGTFSSYDTEGAGAGCSTGGIRYSGTWNYSPQFGTISFIYSAPATARYYATSSSCANGGAAMAGTMTNGTSGGTFNAVRFFP